MADHWHVIWLREGVAKWNRRRKKVSFIPELSGVNFFSLLPSDFRDSPKTSRYFEGIDLSGADLSHADLSGLNFSKANFSNSNLSYANLSKSNFSRAKFVRANISHASIFRSIFEGAILEDSDFDGVSFKGAYFSGASILSGNITELQACEARDQKASVFLARSDYLKKKSNGYVEKSLGSEVVKQKYDERTKKNRYDVFFGTNRVPEIERGDLVGFGNVIESKLNYGVCEVIVPDGHRIGSLGSPLWKRLLNKSDDRLRLDSIISLNLGLFGSLIQETSGRMRVKERPTIFIHGFNTTFKQAVLRAAQIGYDLGLGQGIGLFSWPSKGKLLGYSADEASAEASKYALADFIEQFVDHSTQNSVNVIAHSMGCRCALGALEVLSNGRKGVLKSINQVILAAADVDTAIMPGLAGHAVKYCNRTTSYASDQDKALKLSGWLHSFPRVGISPPTFVLTGMDTVVVNNLDLGCLSHGYIGTSRLILSDIFNLIKNNFPPEDRHSIEEVSSEGMKYWRMKD